jgi:hypothetical protein
MRIRRCLIRVRPWIVFLGALIVLTCTQPLVSYWNRSHIGLTVIGITEWAAGDEKGTSLIFRENAQAAGVNE